MIQGVIVVAAVVVSSRGGKRGRWRWLLALDEGNASPK
jgi:hypothetical protein